jgi:hypothetical protein
LNIRPPYEAERPGSSRARAETFKLFRDPLFVDKVRDVVGLYRQDGSRTTCQEHTAPPADHYGRPLKAAHSSECPRNGGKAVLPCESGAHFVDGVREQDVQVGDGAFQEPFERTARIHSSA